MKQMATGYLQAAWGDRRGLALFTSAVFCLLAVGHYGWTTKVYKLAFWHPRFTCEQVDFNCGEVSQKKTIKHDFVIQNHGWRSLHIKVSPGCGSCSKVKTSKEDIAPGSASNVQVLLDVGKLKKGDFKKQVLVTTNDPRSPKVVLSLYGKAT